MTTSSVGVLFIFREKAPDGNVHGIDNGLGNRIPLENGVLDFAVFMAIFKGLKSLCDSATEERPRRHAATRRRVCRHSPVYVVNCLRANISAVRRTLIEENKDPVDIADEGCNEGFDVAIGTSLIKDDSVMTVVTPITMPRMVSPERILLARSVSIAIRTDSREWLARIAETSQLQMRLRRKRLALRWIGMRRFFRGDQLGMEGLMQSPNARDLDEKQVPPLRAPKLTRVPVGMTTLCFNGGVALVGMGMSGGKGFVGGQAAVFDGTAGVVAHFKLDGGVMDVELFA